MNWQEYVPLAIRTAKPLEPNEQREHALLGMITELGELADVVKRVEIYNATPEALFTNLREEAGDLAWYIALYCDTRKLTILSHGSSLYRHMPSKALVYEMCRLINSLLDPHSETAREEMVIRYLLATTAELLARYNGSMQDALQLNIVKLAKRYGDKYSDFNALNRDLEAERRILEG